MTPEELLRQTSQANRTTHQQGSLKQQKIQVRQTPHAVALPYDGDRGCQQIQLSDGSIREAESNSNGVIGLGESVQLHQGMGRSRINVMPHKSRQPKQVPLQSQSGPVKILFSTVIEEVRNFYVGGDRLTPRKIFSLPQATSFSAYIANTGKQANNWIASIYYADAAVTKLKIITPAQNWELSGTTDTPFRTIYYRGAGFWASNPIEPSIDLGEILGSTQDAGTIDCSFVTYALKLTTYSGIEYTVQQPFLSATVSYTGSFLQGDDGGEPPVKKDFSRNTNQTIDGQVKSFAAYLSSELEERVGSLSSTNADGFAATCDDITNDQFLAEDNKSMPMPLAPNFYKTNIYERTFSQNVNSGNVVEETYEKTDYYLPQLTGIGSTIAQRVQIEISNGDYLQLVNQNILINTTDDSELVIPSGSPLLNVDSLNSSIVNLVGNKLYSTPISSVTDARGKNLTTEVSIYTLTDNEIAETKKKTKVFSLRSPDCTIHSASAHL